MKLGTLNLVCMLIVASGGMAMDDKLPPKEASSWPCDHTNFDK